MFTLIITLWDYLSKTRKGWNLWEEVNLLCKDKDELQCYEAIKNKISAYDNEEKDSKITKRNLQVLEAFVAKNKATVVLIPITFSWFITGENISLDALQAGSLDSIMGVILILFSGLALMITLEQYPKLAFVEKVVEEMVEEINSPENK